AIELSALYLSIKADEYYTKALKADSAMQLQQKKAELEKAVKLLLAADRLLQSHPSNTLQSWVALARVHGKNEQQKNYYEQNAKRLITTWGGYQNDYAARMWSGLIRDYYIPRMRLQLSGKKKDLPAWEEAWITTPWVNKTQAFDDPLAAAIELIKNN
ncbi:MAG: alpha-N-acetylglucosaminidase C-terminal domain-containing protein, partial [Panacibacter sp.]